MSISKHIKKNQTSQRHAVLGKNQVKNQAGGYVFTLEPLAALRRFLILGTEGGSYYASERKATVEAFGGLVDCIRTQGLKTVAEIEQVLGGGLSPKRDYALLALATCFDKDVASEDVRYAARVCALKVIRTASDMYLLQSFLDDLGIAKGRTRHKLIGQWLQNLGSEKMAYQALKYQGRHGYSFRDLLRIGHPKLDEEGDAVAGFVCGKDKPVNTRIINGYKLAKEAKTAKEVAKIAQEYRLVREMIPTEHLTDVAVQEALLQEMPVGAMIRNLGNMTKSGLLKPLSDASQLVCERLVNEDLLRKARIHPVNALMALKTYAGGRSNRGNGSWVADQNVVTALDQAFVKCFKFLEPANKRTLIGLDVSSSMGWEGIAGTDLTAAQGAAAMAMATVRTEPRTFVHGFCDQFVDLGISKADSLTDVIRKTANKNFGRTDCAQPMLYATKAGLEVDTFIIYTDNETWAGDIHPFQALKKYREKSGIPARLIVVGMTATRFTIADPSDPGMLDVVGFDSSAPKLIADFSAGRI